MIDLTFFSYQLPSGKKILSLIFFLVLALVFSSPFNTSAQSVQTPKNAGTLALPVQFQKSYGGTNDDTDKDSLMSYGIPTKDGGYMIVSTTKSYGNGGSDIYFIKLNPFGDTLWTKTYGTNTDETAASIQQTSDKGYIIAGYKGALPAADMLITKVDSLGNPVFVKTYGTSGAVDRANYAEEILGGGGYIITGKTFTTGAASGVGVVKLDASGNQSFANNYYFTNGYDEGFSISQVGTGFFIGAHHKSGSNSSVPYFFTMNSNGTSSSGSKTVALNGANFLHPVLKNTPDGGYLLCGSSNPSSGGHGLMDIWLMKFDNTGGISWVKIYGGPGNDFGRAIAITKSGNYVIAGSVQNFGAGMDDAFLMCINPAGTVLWAKAYGGNNIDKANSVYETPDKGFFVCGETSSFTSGGTDIYAIKTDSMGNAGCNEVSITSFTGITFGSTSSSNASPLTGGLVSNSIAAIPSKPGKSKIVSVCTACPFPIQLSKTDIKCAGPCNGSATVTVTGAVPPLTYSWSTIPVQTTQTAMGLCAQTYTVTVKDNSGCSVIDTITIKQPLLLSTPFTSTNATCGACNGTATITPAGGTPPYTFQWTTVPVQTTATATGLCAGSFPFVVTDKNACSQSGSATITQAGSVTVTISPGSKTICSGTSVSLSASTNGTVYAWSTGETTSSIVVTPASTTTYSVMVSSTSTCSATATVTITVLPSPTVSISGPGNMSICRGDITTLTASVSPSSGNTYSWNTGSTASSIIVSPTTTTGYTVTVTNGTSGCSTTRTVSVTVNTTPTPTISAPSTLCIAQTATLTASGGTTYLWNPGGATTSALTIQPFTSGPKTYSVIASNGNCSAIASVTITVKPLPTITTQVSDSVICKGDLLTLTAFGGISYSWANLGFTNPVVFVPSVSSTYTVGGLGSNGCWNYAVTGLIRISTISVNAGSDQTICPGYTANLQAFASGDTAGKNFWWHPGSTLNDSTVANPSANPDSTTITYALEVFNSHGCWGKDTVTVFVNLSPACSIHIYNGITPNGDGNNDIWWIDGIQAFPDNNVHIFNRWGNKVWFASGYDNNKVKWRGQNMNGEALPSGTYYYVIDIKIKGKVEARSGWVEVTR